MVKQSRIMYAKDAASRFKERTGTAMSRLRTFALKLRNEGKGIKASGRVIEKSHKSIMRWEQKLAVQSRWSPPAGARTDITVEGDEVYTCVGKKILGYIINHFPCWSCYHYGALLPSRANSPLSKK